MMLRRALPAVLLLVAVGGWLATPVRWQVEGLSMAPGLVPGDIVASRWIPALDRWRAPRRFERWTFVEPAGDLAVKRVWGLPGEEISIVDGDLVVDGAVVVKPPAVLAELALPVPCAIRRDAAAVQVAIDQPVLDDVPFAPNEQRLLASVRDIGIAALVNATAPPGCSLPPIEVCVGDRSVRVRLPTAGTYAIAAGRLDGCFVAGAWPINGKAWWGLERPWTGTGTAATWDVTVFPGSGQGDVRVERVAAWRDVHLLPAVNGTTCWRLAHCRYFLLGDFPGGSHDARHWGPIETARLRQRVVFERPHSASILVSGSPGR